MHSLTKATLALIGVASLAGCSSIIEGRSQELTINTNPSGATCTLVRNGMPIGTVSPTPSAILIEKTKYDIVVKCNKGGYQEATYFNKSDAAGATVGNIILGGGIGWAIDSATGSDNKYESPINLSMVPEERHVASHKPHRQKEQVEAKASPTPADKDTAVLMAQKPDETNGSAGQSDFPTEKNGGR